MSSRVIKDCISNHPLVAILDEFTQDQLIRWILLADDWGCFNADLDVIRGACYAKRPAVTIERIASVRNELYDTGFLFLWTKGAIVWASWTWWEFAEFANTGSVNEDGGRKRNRRKTPEPPSEMLTEYLQTHPFVVTQLDAVGRTTTQPGCPPPSLFLPPPPVPVSPDLPSGDPPPRELECDPSTLDSIVKKPYGEFGYTRLTDAERAKLTAKLNGHSADYIDRFDLWVAEAPEAKVGRARVRRREINAYPMILRWFNDDVRAGKLTGQSRPGEATFVPTNN